MSTTVSEERDVLPSSDLVPLPTDRWMELGLGIVVIAVPLAFIPKSSAPFLDVKLPLVLAACLALRAAGTRGHRLARPAAAWIAAAALAGILGVDPWLSLTGAENSGNGLLLLGASAFLLVSATATPAEILPRIPGWLIGTATATAMVALADRLLPGSLPLVGDLSFAGGTVGHPVFLSAFMAAGIAATVALERIRGVRLAALLVILTSALDLSTKRVGWIALVVGLAVALWRGRPAPRRTLLIVGVVAATLTGWAVIDATVRSGDPLSGAGRFSELATGSARARVTAMSVLERGWSDRPLLGWGPGNTWSAYLSSVTEHELRFGERGTNDAHNLFVEAGVTTGIIGLSALLILACLTLHNVRRGSRAVGWAAGSAAALAVGHLLQPISVSLTPLLFVLAGLACIRSPHPSDRPPAGAARRRRFENLGRIGGALLAGALIVSLAVLSSSVLERYGRTYASEWALRAAHRIAPERISTSQALALHLAMDGRSGDAEAAAEAVSLAEDTVRRHRWHPVVYLMAADVHLVLRDPGTASIWIRRHRQRFPADPVLPETSGGHFVPPHGS